MVFAKLTLNVGEIEKIMVRRDKQCIAIAIVAFMTPIILVSIELLIFNSSSFRLRNSPIGYLTYLIPTGLIVFSLRNSSLDKFEKVVYGIGSMVALLFEILILGFILLFAEGELPHR